MLTDCKNLRQQQVILEEVLSPITFHHTNEGIRMLRNILFEIRHMGQKQSDAKTNNMEVEGQFAERVNFDNPKTEELIERVGLTEYIIPQGRARIYATVKTIPPIHKPNTNYVLAPHTVKKDKTFNSLWFKSKVLYCTSFSCTTHFQQN